MDPLKVRAVEGGDIPVRQDLSAEKREQAAPAKEESEGSREAQEEAPEEIEGLVSSRQELSFSVDEKTHEVIARIVDRESGEVIREFPSKELRKVQEALDKASKHLFDQIA